MEHCRTRESRNQTIELEPLTWRRVLRELEEVQGFPHEERRKHVELNNEDTMGDVAKRLKAAEGRSGKSKLH